LRRIAFGLGANLGDRVAALQGAVDIIAPELEDAKASRVYETAPVGGPEQPSYANAVLIGWTDLPPMELLALAHRAEQEWSRTREIRWGPRTLDVDVLDIEGVVSEDPILTLPHPRAVERAFVVVPWLEIEPAAVLADSTVLSELADVVSQQRDTEIIRARSDVVLVITS
jgi:2-amino-4-hydroxy-6-hydroxymethyldihydropteridine diphosphokinase